VELVFASGTGLLFFDMKLRKPKVVAQDGEHGHILKGKYVTQVQALDSSHDLSRD
jgi:hypothetical protein